MVLYRLDSGGMVVYLVLARVLFLSRVNGDYGLSNLSITYFGSFHYYVHWTRGEEVPGALSVWTHTSRFL